MPPRTRHHAEALYLLLAATASPTGCSEQVSAIPAETASAPAASPSVTPAPTPTAAAQPFRAVIRSGQIEPANAIDLATAGPAALYLALQQGDGGNRWSIERIHPATGAVVTRRMTLPFLSGLTVGPYGLYVSTSVIDKYGRKPDTIVRLDATTLKPLAERPIDPGAFWNGSVHLAAKGDLLAEADGGGDVRLPDPRTLATRITTRVLADRTLQAGGDIESPVVFSGRLWVFAHHSLLSFDLAKLAQTSEVPQQGYEQIVAAGGRLELVGRGTAHVSPRGAIEPEAKVAGLDGEQQGSQRAFGLGEAVLEQPESLKPSLVVRAPDGRVLRTLELDSDTGRLLGAIGHTVWALGVPGQSGNVTAIRIS